jgi:mono/diheme cytochrome c family protein
MRFARRSHVGASLAVLAAAWLAGCGNDTRSLGAQIYLDGVGEHGRLPYTQGPEWLRFASAGCAVCHGQAGQGLVVQAGDVTGAAPPLTRAALAERGYDPAALRRAITEGVDHFGREFHYYMPRWTMSEQELDALLAFLDTL